MNNKTRKIMHLGMLLALEIILSRFFSINTPIVRISFAFVPLVLCAMMYGPIWSSFLGGLSDFIGAILFPVGPYFPGFTLSGVLSGLCYGLFLNSRQCSMRKILLLVCIQRIVISLCLSTYFLTFLVQVPFYTLLIARVIQNVVLMPVQFAIIFAITKKEYVFNNNIYVLEGKK